MTDIILLNSYNTTGAGTSNITKFILTSLFAKEIVVEGKIYIILPDIKIFREFKSMKNIRIIKIPVFFGVCNYVFRCFYDLLMLPLLSITVNPSAVIIMANYAPMVVHGKKVVFMRHPYLVENSKVALFSRGLGFIEYVRRIVFRITLLSSDLIIVQSNYMKKRLTDSFRKIPRISVLPNPVSNLMTIEGIIDRNSDTKSKIVLYVSRFYPHKNHKFLLLLADKYQAEFRIKNIKFYITVDSSTKDKICRLFLSEINTLHLNDIIINIGEMPNEKLQKYYSTACCFFFPSRLETFGNPLVEAMAFNLPVVAPDLNYVNEICGNACLYYVPEDVDDAYKKLMVVLFDSDLHCELSNNGVEKVKNFPSVAGWYHRLISLV